MKLFTLLTLPFIAVWLATRNRLRAYRWLGFLVVLFVKLFALLPVVATGLAWYAEQITPVTAERAAIYPEYTVINSALHGANGWRGVDIAAGCGMPVYAPFSGIVEANNIDHQGNPTLTIRGNGNYLITLLHGDYVVEVGDRVKTGQIIGTENLTGYFVGAAPICHSHVILKQNGRELNYLEWQKSGVHLVEGSYPLRISWYDPVLGGTNCDNDCSTMASGDKVATWLGGRGGVYAAACPRSDGWHHGKRFELDGVIYECRDTGGWINCYQPGQIDLAIQNAHSRGYLLDVPMIAEQPYCWVDLLNGSQYQYGSLAYDWGFVTR